MAERRPANVYTADLGDLDLSPEVSDRIAKAVQRAVLLEIAGLDLAPRYSVSLVPPRDAALQRSSPTTDGIYVQSAE